MNNKIKFIATCRFPSWGENNQYPAYGVKYLIEVPIEKCEELESFFAEKYKEVIGRGTEEFNGELLFIEEVDICIL